MIHPLIPQDWHEDLKSLAKKTAEMRYDALADFLHFLREEFAKQAQSDGEKNRTQLSESMRHATKNLHEAEKHVRKAWRISEPYMK